MEGYTQDPSSTKEKDAKQSRMWRRRSTTIMVCDVVAYVMSASHFLRREEKEGIWNRDRRDMFGIPIIITIIAR